MAELWRVPGFRGFGVWGLGFEVAERERPVKVSVKLLYVFNLQGGVL